MNTYYLKRVGMAGITIYTVITLSFLMIRWLPGGPEDFIIAQVMQSEGAVDYQRVRRLAEAYINIRTDDPLHIQYIDYLISTLQGDLGTSVLYNQEVTGIIAEALPWTVFVMAIGISMSFFIGIMLGAAMALYEGSNFDIGTTVVTLFTNSVPYYVVAVILLLTVGYQWSLFPVSGRVDGSVAPGFNMAFIGSVFYHAALPALSLIIARIGGVAIGMRSNSISVLGEDYMRVARLRGLSDSRITTRYVSRNAILPLYTGIMMSIGSLFGGSVILEKIFRYEGIGYYFFQAIGARDYPLMMGAFILTTTAVVTSIMLADLTYGLIDPRISTGGEEA